MKCWYCEQETGLKETDYGDHRCPKCSVEISLLNPTDYKPYEPTGSETEEEKMAVNYKDEKYQGKFIFLPLIGEELIADIKEVKEVKCENPKLNFSENVPVMANGEQVIDDDQEPVFKKKDLGYHIEAELTNGKILVVTSMAAFRSVFKKHEINDGDKVRILHKDKGEWIVEKI
jgi:hypothetical protein